MNEVALISCCKSKLETVVHVPADELYMGNLFRAQLAYARQVLALPDNRIFVLSAKYQLLGIKWPALPYEKTLTQMSKSARQEWAIGARMTLYTFLPEIAKAHLLAGSTYRESIRPFLEERGVVCVTPHPPSYGYGKQVAWYRQQVGAHRG